MIICMFNKNAFDFDMNFDIVCVTNRKLCQDDFFERVKDICHSKVNSIILREKDLSEDEYYELAGKVLTDKKCREKTVIHNFPQTAIRLDCRRIHLPLYIFENMSITEKEYFDVIGVSCHSVDDAKKAEELGASYVTAGHIFETKCKKGILPRGLVFLSDICKNVSIPVYAIGGISDLNISDVKNAGADGACFMSSFMICENAEKYVEKLSEKIF